MAEEPLPSGGACLLGSINLAAFVKDGKFDYKEFDYVIAEATTALIEIQREGIPYHPLQIQKDSASLLHQIGLGVMGIADMLIKLGMKYGSEESLKFCDKLADRLFKVAFSTSQDYNSFLPDSEKYLNNKIFDSNFVASHNVAQDIAPYNSQLLTIAPTGSISTMIGVSGGIEPIFAFKFYRTTKSLHNKDVTYEVNIPLAQEYIDKHPNEELPDYFVSSADIEYTNRIKMQYVWQKHIDASISSTINLPKETSVEDVYNIYMEAWKSQLKGVTIYRDGCKRAGILNTSQVNTDTDIVYHSAPKRPKSLNADYYEIKVKGDNFIVIVGLFNNKPYEIFILPNCNRDFIGYHKGNVIKNGKKNYSFKSDSCTIANIAYEGEDEKDFVTITLMVSQLLRHGVSIEHIIHTLKKTNSYMGSFISAIIRVLNKYMENTTEESCPDCGGKIIHENGCKHCENCGWSACLCMINED